MMETAHKDVLNEIERSRVKSISSSSAEQSKTTGLRARTYFGGYKTQNQVHGKSSNTQASDLSDDGDINSTINSRSRSMRASVNTEDQPEVEKFLNEGLLYKTSRGKITSDLTRGQHEHRQHRRFQLTEHSLEYSQLLQRVS